MKSIITLICILLLNNAGAQIARMLNITNAFGPGIQTRNTILVDNGGEQYVITTKNSSINIEFTIFKLDGNLETSNYKSISTIIPANNFVLCGGGFNNAGYLTVSINQENSTHTQLLFITMNVQTGSVLNVNIHPTNFNKGYSRFIEKGDSLVSCLVSTNNNLVRLSIDKTSPANFNESIIETGITSQAPLNTGRKVSDIIFGNLDEEYYLNSGIVYKRSNQGTISSTQLNSGLGSASIGFNGNELAVLSGNQFYTLTPNLSQINSGTININELTGFIELNSLGNFWIVYFSYFTGGQKIVINPSSISTSVNSEYSNKNSRPIFTIRQNGKNYLFSLPNLYNAIEILKDDQINASSKSIELTQELVHNSIRFYSGHRNNTFTNPNSTGGFNEINTNAATIFSNSIGLIGVQNNSLEGIYMPLINSSEEIEFGPYKSSDSLVEEMNDKYCRGYFVTKSMIDDHVLNFNNSNYLPPFSIAQWPGNGNTTIGQDEIIAPFFDANSNEIYEPSLGEYPLIFGDECLLNVFHKKPLGSQINGTQVLQYEYYFNCSDEVLESTIFIRQKFKIYESNLDSAYFSVFTDFDLGGPADDYIGTNVHLGMGYVYNADANDLNDGAALGFGTNLPAQGAMILKGGKLTYDNLDNSYGIGSNQTMNGFGFEDGIIDNEYYTLESSLSIGSLFPNSSPTTIYKAYLASQGILSDGSFNTVSFTSTTVYYDFFGNSDPLFYASNGVDHGNNWTETNTGNPGGDRRMILGSKADNMIAADPLNNTTEIVVAYILAYNHTAPLADPVQDLFDKGQALKDLYASGQNSCGVSFDLQTSELNATVVEHFFDVKLFPNPTNSSLTIRLENNNFTYELSDLNFNKILEGTSTSNSEIIDLGRMNAGIYFLNISQDGKLSRKKVVKM